MGAVLLACLSAVLFGALTVWIRFALRRSPSAILGALVATGVAAGLAVVAALVEAPFRGEFDLGEIWPFALAGLIAPGISQLVFTFAVKHAGASRTSVVVGAAPLVAVAIAVALLDEPLRLALVAGAILIVLGGLALLGERVRPHDFRGVGLALAVVSTICFSIRDNLVRWLAGDTDVAPMAAAAAALVAGSILIAGYALANPARRGRLLSALQWFAPAGFLFGLSYLSLFEAYYRGRVTVVSPLVATESLWGVLLAALFFGRSELVGRRLVGGALLVVAGGALIGAFR
jgi:drug/metabolite transporter (DMT)-like permease